MFIELKKMYKLKKMSTVGFLKNWIFIPIAWESIATVYVYSLKLSPICNQEGNSPQDISKISQNSCIN